MILTCPECASRYFVDDAKVGPQGRNVRCANCSHRWHAAPPPAKAAEPAPTPVPAPTPEPAAAAPAPTELPGDLAFVESEAAAAPDPAVASPDPQPLEPAKPKPQKAAKPQGAGMGSGLIWAALALILGAIAAAVVVFRADIVRAVPRTASAYAAIGLPVNPVGLVIEDIRARPALQDGHAALIVTGVLRNVEDHEVMAPPLRVSLLNPAGKTVSGKIAAADDPLIPAGESRHFAVELLDPPSTSKDLAVSFILDGTAPTPVKAAVPAQAAEAHAEEPADASAETPRLRGPPTAEASHAEPAPAAAEHH